MRGSRPPRTIRREIETLRACNSLSLVEAVALLLHMGIFGMALTDVVKPDAISNWNWLTVAIVALGWCGVWVLVYACMRYQHTGHIVTARHFSAPFNYMASHCMFSAVFFYLAYFNWNQQWTTRPVMDAFIISAWLQTWIIFMISVRAHCNPDLTALQPAGGSVVYDPLSTEQH